MRNVNGASYKRPIACGGTIRNIDADKPFTGCGILNIVVSYEETRDGDTGSRYVDYLVWDNWQGWIIGGLSTSFMMGPWYDWNGSIHYVLDYAPGINSKCLNFILAQYSFWGSRLTRTIVWSCPFYDIIFITTYSCIEPTTILV